MEEKKLRTLRLVAMTLGVLGSAVLLSSLLMEFCSFTDNMGGSTSISVINYVDARIIVVFGLIEMCCVFSLWNFAVPQILTGTFIGLWSWFMIWDIRQRVGDTAEYLRADLGLGIYMFILSSGLILASGIIFVVFLNKCKRFGIDDGKPRMIRKAELFGTISLVFSIFFICVAEALKHTQ